MFVFEIFDFEFFINYEIVFCLQWFDCKVMFNVNVFYFDWCDQQVFILGLVGINDGCIENVGVLEFIGMEFEMCWQVNFSFELFIVFGYIKMEFIDFLFFVDQDGNVIDFEFVFFDGNEFQMVLNFIGLIGVYYNNLKGYFGDVIVSYMDSLYFDIFNLFIDEIEVVIIINLCVGYGCNQWWVYIFVNNLFDECIQMF